MQLRPYQSQAIKECWEALKKNDNPVLLMASVGAGKSLMLSVILLSMQNAGKRALCLVNNAELVRNNCETFNQQGGKSSIYCAALGSKDSSAPIIFGTPQSIINGIMKNEDIAKIVFNLIVVDEAHNINYLNDRSVFLRILRHYKQLYNPMRLLGATGTDFRFKGTPIVGDKALFKSKVGNITTAQLIKDGYLIKPHFEIDSNLVLDFSNVKVKQNGFFDQKQLEVVIENSVRLTELICKQLIHIMQSQKRFGVFIFATTKKHAYEILSHLPPEESAIILGETPQDERTEILDKSRSGNIKYLVNISIISVGVDIPAFDTIAYLRPTESLVLLVQTMGRVLRLSERTGKKESLVLDFAGNLERHRDWDNPLLLEALRQTIDKDKPLVIQCPACSGMNTEHARRCVGLIYNKRCDYYFEFKNCPNEACQVKNDIAARHCRVCNQELIDPNGKLTLDNIKASFTELKVIKARYSISETSKGYRVKCMYKCKDSNGNPHMAMEYYSPINEKAMRVFYGQFVRKHCQNSSEWYPYMHSFKKMGQMLQIIDSPFKLLVEPDRDNWKIKKKFFEISV